MEHEEAYLLMMEALDDRQTEGGRHRLDAHLSLCSSCSREWQAVRAIDDLFRHTAALSPAAGFAHRTLARLPNGKYRLWFVSALYGLVFLSGLTPVLVLVGLLLAVGPAVQQPALLRSLLASAGQVIPVVVAILSGLWRGLGNLGELLAQQPAVIGWFFIMVGFIALWGSVYSQALGPSRQRA